MKVFLSWSGESSRLMAEALREWLPNVLQAVDPWMSAEDIDKGARWNSDIAGELSKTKVGIICVTSDNLDAPWLNFEAGALSKTLEKTLVCPYLIGLKPADLRGPLVQFQATVAERGDTRRLVGTINAALEEGSLSDRQLEKTFEIWWPELEKLIEKIRLTKTAPKARRSEREILEEILALTRSQARQSLLGSSIRLVTSEIAKPISHDPDAAAWPKTIAFYPNAVLYGGGEAVTIQTTEEESESKSSVPEADVSRKSASFLGVGIGEAHTTETHKGGATYIGKGGSKTAADKAAVDKYRKSNKDR